MGLKVIAVKSNGLSSKPMTPALEGELTPALTPADCPLITIRKP